MGGRLFPSCAALPLIYQGSYVMGGRERLVTDTVNFTYGMAN